MDLAACHQAAGGPWARWMRRPPWRACWCMCGDIIAAATTLLSVGLLELFRCRRDITHVYPSCTVHIPYIPRYLGYIKGVQYIGVYPPRKGSAVYIRIRSMAHIPLFPIILICRSIPYAKRVTCVGAKTPRSELCITRSARI